MTSPDIAGQYSSVKPFLGKANLANVIGEDDIARIKAYDYYENAYYNRPETLKVVLRGSDGDEQQSIFLPSVKKIVEATNRFLAVDFDFVADPSLGTPADQLEVSTMLQSIFKREKVHKKFANNRRYGLIRGDAMFHITADDTKLEGTRISIHELDPRNYFPIPDLFDANRIAGCYLVDIVQDPKKLDDKTKKVARRQTYRRTQDAVGNFTGEVTTELELFELGKWDARNMKPADIKSVGILKPPTPLDPLITNIPVYHWKNNEIPGLPFGNSEVSGIETIINAINQSISDEDITLVMQGLGMYSTDAAPPQDEAGNDTDWQIGPKTVIEVGDGQFFNRVSGVSTVAPFQEHIKFMDDYANQALGIPDIAAGRVDVAVAESGISLLLQLMPIIAKNAEKELEILGTTDQMLFDLVHGWLPAYEALNKPDVMVTTVVGDPMPDNREASINELLGLVSNLPQVITQRQVREKMAKYGYTWTPEDIAELDALAAAQNADPYAADMGDGAAADDGSGEPVPVE